uniref:Chromo domain-containing protein n=1 Tax=Phytophthora ramorum TaxID=164328 RepID=H3GA32_PHYRM
MDFVTGLPESNGFDAIMTVVDKLSKRPKYRACNTTDDAEKTAHHFFDCVVRHHGLPSIIISDRDPKFIPKFWSSLTKLMGISLHMTTSYRAQADGQTERQNLILEDALRCRVSYHGSDWSEHLGTIEYAHPTLVSASTGMSPFELDTGRKERNPINPLNNPTIVTQMQQGIGEYAKRFQEQRPVIIQQAKTQLRRAQERQKNYYDQKITAITFKTGDLVMLDTRRIPSGHVTKDIAGKRAKLAARKVGPYTIERMINPNVAKLNLPRSMRFLNPTFNVDVLSHYVENPSRFATRPIPKVPRIIIDDDSGETKYIVEKLLRKRQFNRKPERLVKWHGLADHESTWEREKDIKHVSHWHVLVEDFKKHQREVKSGRM